MAYQLRPLPQQVGVFPQFIARQTETLVLKERILSLSGDSFDVTLAGSGQALIKVQGSVLSLSGRKAVSDPAGNLLFHIRREHLHIHATYALENAGGVKFCEVKSSMQLFGSKATATFTTPATGKTQTLTMKGNWLDTNADIVDSASGAVVARIDRKLLNARDLLFGQQSYAVVVAPGADMALIAALCICLDEKNNEK